MDRPDLRPTDVYLAYDREGRLLYVGATVGFRARLGHHKRVSEWWPQTTRLEVEHYPNRAAALDREAAVVGEFLPPYNSTAHTLWRQRDERIIKYRQQGWTNPRIAAEEGMSREAMERTIKRLLAQGRIQPRPAGRKSRERKAP